MVHVVTADEFQQLDRKMDRLLEWLAELRPYREESRVYDNKGLCEKLNISSKTLQKYRDEGLIEFSQVRRKITYTEQAVNKFINQHSIKAYALKNKN
jgi:hypothetical protein